LQQLRDKNARSKNGAPDGKCPMKTRFLFALALGITFSLYAISARAQTPTSSGLAQPEATGEVTGMLVNRSVGGNIPEDLSIMLHVLDQNYSQIGMYHTQSQPGGNFRFEEVPLNPGEFVVGIVSYLGATYSSQPSPFDGKSSPNIELPIYETSTDLSQVQVDELHVLFNFAQDGLEVSEIYLLSNLGDRTITGTLTLTDSQPATFEFPLPVGADYVFFKPDSSDRFVKLSDSFVDKAPLVPGKNTSQFMVSYLAPYEDKMSYSYTAPIAIGNIDFLLPAEEGVMIYGQNLQGPEITTLQDSSVYQIYTYKGLQAGQNVSFDFLGKPNFDTSSETGNGQAKSNILTSKLAIELSSGLVGLAMIGVGVWQWRRTRQDDSEVDTDNQSDKSSLNEIIAKIARLDEAKDRGEIDTAEHQQRRASLRNQAKAILDEKEDEL
jgi:hypothetical protein